MKMRRRIAKLAAFALLPIVLTAACGKKPSEPPISAEQVPQVLDDAFKQAQPEASAAAKEVISSARTGDPAALQQTHELTARPDLTDEQRKAAFRAAAALHQKVVEDAARGDQKAEEALKVYRATK